MADKGAEDSVYRAAKDGLKRWLSQARDKVMAPWRQYKAQPNPQAIAATVPLWQEQVDRILAALTPALREGWAAAHLPGDFDPMDPYIRANLALTYNLLVGVPDEVHAMVVREILEGANTGNSIDQIAQRIDDLLTFTGQENWDNRARTIAITESTRHRNSSLLAHGLLSQKNGRQDLMKQWDTTMDGRERLAHRLANDQVRSLGEPFIVDGEKLLFPGDPTGSPENVCNCVPSWQPVSVRATGFVVRAFSGMLIDLITAEGHKLTATTNHPVLTRSGWHFLGTIKPGDYVLCCTEPRPPTSTIDPDVAHCEPTAEEISTFLQLLGAGNKGMVSVLVDLNGDMIDHKVDVIRTNRLLTLGRYTKQLEQLGQLSIHRGLDEVGFAAHLASIKFADESESICFSGSSGRKANFSDGTTDSVPPNSKLLSHGVDRHASVIHRSNTVSDAGTYLSVGAGVQTMLLQGLVDDPRRDSQVTGDPPSGQSLMMKTNDDRCIGDSFHRAASWHRVTSISQQWHEGPVYDFETIDGLFSAGGVVVANCRCDLRLLHSGSGR